MRFYDVASWNFDNLLLLSMCRVLHTYGLDCGLDCWTGLMDWITGHSKSRNEKMRNGKRGNKEMRKWEESTLHFTQQTADILLLQSSSAQCDEKVNVCPAFIESIICSLQFAPKGYAMALHIASWSAS